MNIHEMATRTGISLKSLRKLEKLRLLKVDAESDIVSEIRFHFARSGQMTVAHMLALIDNPNVIQEFSPAYQKRVKTQLEALGDYATSKAPLSVTASLLSAAGRDPDGALVVAEWLKGVLPFEPVSHYWVSVRLLVGLGAEQRAQYIPLVGLALLHTRALPEFAGYWESKKVGPRNAIFYKKALDL